MYKLESRGFLEVSFLLTAVEKETAGKSERSFFTREGSSVVVTRRLFVNNFFSCLCWYVTFFDDLLTNGKEVAGYN